MVMERETQIIPAFAIGADAGAGKLSISGTEAWFSLAAIGGAVLLTLAGSGWAFWFAATSV
jgi:hypothetical protein